MSPQWEHAACRLGQNLHSTGVFPCSSTILTMTLAAGCSRRGVQLELEVLNSNPLRGHALVSHSLQNCVEGIQ